MAGARPLSTYQGQFEEQVDGAPLSNPRAFSVTPVGTSYHHEEEEEPEEELTRRSTRKRGQSKTPNRGSIDKGQRKKKQKAKSASEYKAILEQIDGQQRRTPGADILQGIKGRTLRELELYARRWPAA